MRLPQGGPEYAAPKRLRRTSAPETQRLKLNACGAPPDLGLPDSGHPDWGLPTLWKPAAGSRSSARRPRHATKATNSLSTVDQPRWAHCNCCLGRSAARRARRPAIRAHFFARAARRNDCNAGASATLGTTLGDDLGDDCDADATQPGSTQHEGTHAAARLLTDADATERSLTQRNRDATERGDAGTNSTQRRW